MAEKREFEGCEVFGTLILGYAAACINLKIVAGSRLQEFIANVVPNGWYGLHYFDNIGKMVLLNYKKAGIILEMAGAAMMTGWYHNGPGKDLVSGGADFLHFQSGAKGYQNVIRGPKELTGAFNLIEFDREKGKALVHSTTPFHRSLEKGVLIGGMNAPGDLVFADVDNSEDENYFHVAFRESRDPGKGADLDIDSPTKDTPPNFDKGSIADLYWRYRDLRKKWERANAFWEATNENLVAAYEKLDAQGKELAEISHRAGMAEVAADVIHSVGNTINGISSAVYAVEKHIDSSSVKGLQKANDLLKENIDDLGRFFTENKKGALLPKYYIEIGNLLEKEREQVLENLSQVRSVVDNVNKIIALQSNLLLDETQMSAVDINSLIADSLKLNGRLFEDNETIVTTVARDGADPVVSLRKSRMIGALSELFRNAVESMTLARKTNRELRIEVCETDADVRISIADNGEGIPKENLEKIFQHGFSTKKGRNGFGLHNCANHLKENKFDVVAKNREDRLGAEFVLTYKKNNA